MTPRIACQADESIRVVFFVERAIGWPNWRTVWQACCAHPQVTPHVVLVPTRDPRGSVADFDEVRALLVEQDVPFFHHRDYDLEVQRPHVAFLAHPYDALRPTELAADTLAARGIRLAYVPYGLETGGGAVNLRYQYGLALHQRAWRIFARSERHRRMFARYCSVGSGHVVVTGHPKIDAVVGLVREDFDPALRARIGERRTVLWTPHFTLPDPPMWSSFDRYVDAILHVIEARPDVFLILRPHPTFFSLRRISPDFGADWVRAFRERVGAMENVELDECADHHRAFALSDALMTDPGSFLLEFLATGKPILYLRHPDGLGLAAEEDLGGAYDVADCGEDIESFVERVARGEDPRADARAQRLGVLLHGVDGRCGERICEAVVEGMRGADQVPLAPPALGTRYARSRELRSGRTREQLMPLEKDVSTLSALHEILQRRGPFRSGLDTNGGDGRFAAIAARFCDTLHVSDVCESLLDATREAFAREGIANVTYAVEAFEDVEPERRVDLALCIDSLVHVLDDEPLARGLDRLAATMRRGATLIVRQATARVEAKVESGDMAFRVMVPDALPRMMRARGLALVEEQVLRVADERSERLYVFEKSEER